MSKTIMILGNTSDSRINRLVEKAKESSIRTVVVGGFYHEASEKAADVYYVLNFDRPENFDELIAIAKEEKTDGVVSAFDKAMFAVMTVAKALGLTGISTESVEKMFCKGKFRELQKESGVFYPEFLYSGKKEDFISKLENFRFPIVVKPDRSSGSKGQSIIEKYDIEAISEAFDTASGASVNKLVCAEEYVNCSDLNILEGDIFVLGDEILWDGLRFCWRTAEEPLVPAGDVMPIHLPEEQLKTVKDTVSMVLKNAECTFGVYNFESYFTDSGEFFIVEINPRQAGMNNTDEIFESCGVDLSTLLVTTAVGDMSYFEELKNFERKKTPILTCTLFADKDGILKGTWISDEYKEHIISSFPMKPIGTQVKKKQCAHDEVAIYHFQFDTEAERDDFKERLYDNIKAITE